MILAAQPALCVAEILFLDPDDVNPGIAALTQHGFEVKILDWIDPCGPTIWVHAFINTELDGAGLLHWVQDIVGSLGGDVTEAGFADPLPMNA
ncbi:MAG: hypothetical protein WAN75_14805 [Xanthobacteraceae bacterium]|jgi:hypothetical protein